MIYKYSRFLALCAIVLGVCFHGALHAESDKVNVVCFGDSITKRGYPTELEKLLEVKTINAGVAGHTSGEGLRRMKKDVLSKNPDVVVIFFGTNDIRVDAKKHVPLIDYEKNLKKMIANCKKQNALVVICTPPPINEEVYFTRHEKKVYDDAGGLQKMLKQYSETVVKIAQKEKIPLVLLDQVLLKEEGWMHKDGVHPTPEGNRIIAKYVAEALEPLLKSAK